MSAAALDVSAECQRVVVEFIDMEDWPSWYSMPEIRKLTFTVMEAHGLLVRNDADMVIVGRCVSHEEVLSLTMIPKPCVRAIREE